MADYMTTLCYQCLALPNNYSYSDLDPNAINLSNFISTDSTIKAFFDFIIQYSICCQLHLAASCLDLMIIMWG